jgi:hypothetical protein
MELKYSKRELHYIMSSLESLDNLFSADSTGELDLFSLRGLRRI